NSMEKMKKYKTRLEGSFMNGIYEKIIAGNEKVAVIGLGYVGLPLAVSFAKHIEVMGFDIDNKKNEKYKNGIDVTKEIGDNGVLTSKVDFTSNEKELNKCKFLIVAVPTPVNSNKIPDLTPVINASKTVGRN